MTQQKVYHCRGVTEYGVVRISIFLWAIMSEQQRQMTQVWYMEVRTWTAQADVHIRKGKVCWICVRYLYGMVTIEL